MRTLLLTTLAIITVWGCNADAPAPVEAAPVGGAPHLVPNYDDSKADNYVSTNAREYVLTGQAHVDLPEDFAGMDADMKAMVLDQEAQRALNTVARSLKSHINAVVNDANDLAGDDDRWFTFFKRNVGTTESAVVDASGRGQVDFAVEFVGSWYLMSLIAPEDGSRARTFEVRVDGLDETLTLTVAGTDSRDAFPKYNELFADGVYDIAVQFGGDYNSERFDLDTARWLVDTLIEGGWENPSVTDFESLKIDSPPFTRPMIIEGQPVEARVTIVHSDLVGGETQPLLEEAMRASLATADVIIYSGHAGPGSGFVLDYQPRQEMRASSFATLDLPSKYQIYVFDGCQTYRTYVDDMMKNPNKTFENLDIVTTVNTTPFSVGYQTIHEFVYWLTLTDDAGRHFPVSWKDLLRGLNTRDFRDVHYGVHGIDQDPRLNPHASEGIACQPCASDLDCGAGGNLCLGYSAGAACGVACTTDTACPDGFRCARVTSDPDLFYMPKQCVRRDYTCQ
jgi:hypothetical protein